MITDRNTVRHRRAIEIETPDHTLRCRQGGPSSTYSFQESITRSNFTGQIVYMKSQNNMCVAIPPALVMPEPHQAGSVQTERCYNFVTGEAMLETFNLLLAQEASEYQLSPESAAILEVLKNYLKDFAPGRVPKAGCFTIQYFVSASKLMNQSTFYDVETDTLFSFKKDIISIPHPNSATGLGIRQEELQKDGPNYGMMVKVIDNDDCAPYRYYYSGKNVVTVKSARDKHLASGVYITRYDYSKEGNEPRFTKDVYSFEDAKQLIGLYATIDEARSHGQPDLILETQKAEDARREAELKQLHRETDLKKVTRESDTIDKKSDLEVMKAILERQRLEQERVNLSMKAMVESVKDSIDVQKRYRDDYYDDRSSQRKDRSSHRDDYYDRKSSKRKDRYDDRSIRRKDQSEGIKFAFGNLGTWLALGGVAAGFFLGRRPA